MWEGLRPSVSRYVFLHTYVDAGSTRAWGFVGVCAGVSVSASECRWMQLGECMCGARTALRPVYYSIKLGMHSIQ